MNTINRSSSCGRQRLWSHALSRWLATVAALCLLSCSALSTADQPWSNARQLVLVVADDRDSSRGRLSTYERRDAGWIAVQRDVPVTLGRSGSAWGIGLHPAQQGLEKREGDGRSPAGVFRIGQAFGYESAANTRLHYRPMSEWDYCIDVASSPLYNRIVDARTVGEEAIRGSTEPMRRDLHFNGDRRYELGFVIEHNAAGKPGLGSCIFAHVWEAPDRATAGCTAMAAEAMRELLAWLDAKNEPIFVLLPAQELERLREQWDLPDSGDE